MIIGFTGRAGAGKSTAATIAKEALGGERSRFAGALKAMIRALLTYRNVAPDEIERMIDGDLKDIPTTHFGGKTPRHAMQTLGTEWGRMLIWTDFWIDTEMEHIANGNARHVIIDDVRFENEAAAIWNRRGHVFEITNDRLPPRPANSHASEAIAFNCPAIRNDGSTDDLRRAVQAALQGLD
jgi:hypothetical protein